jgi:hypothetical protein
MAHPNRPKMQHTLTREAASPWITRFSRICGSRRDVCSLFL